MNWNRYHRLPIIYNWMEELANQFPNRVKLNIIGITEEGRNIVVMKTGGGHRTGFNFDQTITFMTMQSDRK